MARGRDASGCSIADEQAAHAAADGSEAGPDTATALVEVSDVRMPDPCGAEDMGGHVRGVRTEALAHSRDEARDVRVPAVPGHLA